jgi:mRNA export factor
VKGGYYHQGPVLDVCWNKVSWLFQVRASHQLISNKPQDGTKLFSGGVDNVGRMYDLTTGQTTQVAQHDAPIKSVGWVDAPQGGILVTGSWDKTIKVRNTSN